MAWSHKPKPPTLCWCVSLFLALLAIVWLGVPLLPPLFVGSVIAPSGCPAHPASCLFSASYDAARTRFRAACTAHPRCTLTTVPLPRTAGSEAPLSDDLTIDFARVAGARATPTGPLLVHVSATHGAEGHAGSAVQLAALRRLAATADAGGDADDADAETTILFVHALNPFGMKYGRRFNERNVDLNRNALFPSVPTFRGAFARLAADPAHVDAYTRVAPVLNDATGWRAPLRANVLFFTRLAGALLNPLGVGFVGLKRCLVAGQYHARDGLYYGGAELEASHAVLIAKLRAEYALHRSVIFLDVHSGLGPPGVDTLLLPAAHNTHARAVWGNPGGTHAANPDERFLAGWSQLPPRTSSSSPSATAAHTVTDAEAGYDLTEGTTRSYIHAMHVWGRTQHEANRGVQPDGTTDSTRWGWMNALHATQEFGTIPGILVVRAMVREHSTWLKLRCASAGAGRMHDVDGLDLIVAPSSSANEAEAACAAAAAESRGVATVQAAAAVAAAAARAKVSARRSACAAAAASLRAAFYVERDDWKEAVARRGVRVVEQALAALRRGEDAVREVLPISTAEAVPGV